jgi:hypothetical protein
MSCCSDGSVESTCIDAASGVGASQAPSEPAVLSVYPGTPWAFDVGCGSLFGGVTCWMLLMWTNENRGRYDRSKLRYPSDLTDDESVLGSNHTKRQIPLTH